MLADYRGDVPDWLTAAILGGFLLIGVLFAAWRSKG